MSSEMSRNVSSPTLTHTAAVALEQKFPEQTMLTIGSDSV